MAAAEVCRQEVYGSAGKPAAAGGDPLARISAAEILALPEDDLSEEARQLRALGAASVSPWSSAASEASASPAAAKRSTPTVVFLVRQLDEANDECDVDQVEALEKIVAGKRANLGTR